MAPQSTDMILADVITMNVSMVLGYSGYFVLGYYFATNELSKRQRIIIYILGAAGFAFTVLADSLLSLKTGLPCSNYYGYFSINVLLEVVAVFIWFRYHTFSHEKVNGFVQKLSGCSFGAYLIHAMIIEQLDLRLGMNTLSFHPLLSVPAIAIITFAISFGISALLNIIPIVKKYLV